MYQFETAVALRNLIAESPAAGKLLRDRQRELQQQVRQVVDDLRQTGWPPERVIIGVKQIARDAGLAPSARFTRSSEPLTNGDALLAQIIRWAIDRYFDTTVGSY